MTTYAAVGMRLAENTYPSNKLVKPAVESSWKLSFRWTTYTNTAATDLINLSAGNRNIVFFKTTGIPFYSRSVHRTIIRDQQGKYNIIEVE